MLDRRRWYVHLRYTYGQLKYRFKIKGYFGG